MFFQVRFQFCTISFVCHEKYPDVLLFTSSVLQVFRHFPLFETPIMQFSSGHPPFLLLPSYLPILKGSEPYRPPRRLNPPRKKNRRSDHYDPLRLFRSSFLMFHYRLRGISSAPGRSGPGRRWISCRSGSLPCG